MLHLSLKFSLLKNLGQFDGLLLILTVIQKGVQKQLLKSGSVSTDNLLGELAEEISPLCA